MCNYVPVTNQWYGVMDEVAYLRTQVDTLAASGVTPQKKAPSREGTPRDSGRKASLASSVVRKGLTPSMGAFQ